MARFVSFLNPSLVDQEGLHKYLTRLFGPGVATAFNANGWKVTQRGAGANMSVDIAVGDGLLARPSGDYGFWGWTTATENVAVTAANPTNPRIDTVVAWVDTSVTTTGSANSPNALKFQIMAGTPGGSPVAMPDVTIQSTLGAAVAWIKLATINVAAGSTSVVNANISDVRTGITGLVNSAVADGSITTAKLAATSVTSAKVDFSTGIWWEEIGRTTLTTSASTISLTSLPARKYLKLKLIALNAGGTIAPGIRFNNDSAGSYAVNRFINGSQSTLGNISNIDMNIGGATAEMHTIDLDIFNVAGAEKLCIGHAMRPNGTGSAVVPILEITGKWYTTTGQITRIDAVLPTGTGLYAAGSELILLGHN
ncbi:hypothetical protein [Mycolicibacterium wolinskyi]|uniref:hypothetical protein n=1 Tax=Mycolicibacterium wolinskyi TaxID=59750 RepID=UPI003917B244